MGEAYVSQSAAAHAQTKWYYMYMCMGIVVRVVRGSARLNAQITRVVYHFWVAGLVIGGVCV